MRSTCFCLFLLGALSLPVVCSSADDTGSLGSQVDVPSSAGDPDSAVQDDTGSPVDDTPSLADDVQGAGDVNGGPVSDVGNCQAPDCIACTTDDDCGPVEPCRSAICLGGVCTDNPNIEGTDATPQVSGDCLKLVCNADGTTTSTPDDADVPAAESCRDVGCSAGAVVRAIRLAGTLCTGGHCDGAGNCLGTLCSTGAECSTGLCVDGVCCADACSGERMTCALAGAEGECHNVPYYFPDPSYMLDGSVTPLTCDIEIAGGLCDGQGGCKRVVGIPCAHDASCMSGDCSPDLKCLGAPAELCSAHIHCASGV